MQLTTQALMVQGTTSDAGKSVLTAGLCRVLARKCIKVAPFKSQNVAAVSIALHRTPFSYNYC
nr:hypothetical protein [Photobacterium indicum]